MSNRWTPFYLFRIYIVHPQYVCTSHIPRTIYMCLSVYIMFSIVITVFGAEIAWM